MDRQTSRGGNLDGPTSRVGPAPPCGTVLSTWYNVPRPARRPLHQAPSPIGEHDFFSSSKLEP